MPSKSSCSADDEQRSGVRGEGMSPQLSGSCVLKAKSQVQLLSLLHPVVIHDGHYSSININVSIKVNSNINSKGKSKSQPELPVSVFGYVGTYTFTLESWHQLGEEIMMSGECFKKRKDSCFPASARDSETIQEMSVVLQSGVHETEKMETQAQTEDSRDDFPKKLPSLVHFFPSSTDSDSTLPCSRSFSDEILLSYCLSSPQVSGATISTIGPKPLQPALGTHSNSETSLGLNIIKIPKKHSIPVLAGEPAVIGEGEDYFLSLFGDTRKLVRSFHEKSWKHFSMILEEVGQSRSSALGDIKIAEVNVKGLFVKLINSSPDKEMEIGNHTLQQNVDGQTISLYRFLPGIIMQANSTVTAVAWYTPIHWKQAWEKLETDIEFDRCSIISATPQRHMFNWPAVATTTKEKRDQFKRESSKCQVEQVQASLKSPWCHSPNVPAHPYCALTDAHNTSTAGHSLNRQPRSTRTDSVQVGQRDIIPMKGKNFMGDGKIL
ncbi:hypothetical protein MJG53_004188 [Ovis ammon polii x Ovis aries]|uniref:Uncharacterized protein n=1 Tax=Ovis ammon polii x Ovis aries TaxID=2918886 RepID=A0ACB9VAA8_9CETA|nr:hypothetical protein MJG53_004188 [Ovis ammon polii x Ovis aries]